MNANLKEQQAHGEPFRSVSGELTEKLADALFAIDMAMELLGEADAPQFCAGEELRQIYDQLNRLIMRAAN